MLGSKYHGIIALQETLKLNLNSPHNWILAYNLIGKSRMDVYGGVAIAFIKGIRFRKIKNFYIIVAETENLNPNLTIVSAYLHLSTDMEHNQLVNFIEVS